MTSGEEAIGCIDPSQVKPSDIAAFYDGDARPEFKKHFEACKFCQSEVAEFTAMATLLQANLARPKPAHRKDCPEIQLLVDYAFGLIESQTATQLQAHLDQCLYCPGEYTQFKADTLTEEELEPTHESATTIIGTFVENVLNRIKAILLPTPSWQVAFRHANSGIDEIHKPRVLEFKAETENDEILIVLHLRVINSRLNIEGMLNHQKTKADSVEVGISSAQSGTDYSSIKVFLFDDQQLISEKTLDESATFSFDPLTSTSKLRLEIHFPNLIIEIGQLE